MKKAIKAKLAPDVAPELVDTHRRVHKANGGEYTADNTTVLDPVDHLKEHNNYRYRSPLHDKLKTVVDDRNQMIKLRIKVENQMLAYKRNVDKSNKHTLNYLEGVVMDVKAETKKLDKKLIKALKALNHPLTDIMLKLDSVGPITIAYLITYIDIEKAKQASAMWSYCGYDKPSHARYQKGQKGGGNKTLRTALYNTASSMIRGKKSPYLDIYINEKTKLAASKREVKTYNTQGNVVTKKWCDVKPGHRHGAAMRKMIKHFLADLWFVWRTIEGLPTRPLYVEEKMGHTGIVKPEERGWKY